MYKQNTDKYDEFVTKVQQNMNHIRMTFQNRQVEVLYLRVDSLKQIFEAEDVPTMIPYLLSFEAHVRAEKFSSALIKLNEVENLLTIVLYDCHKKII